MNLSIVPAFLAGGATWGVLEYVLHRFVGHNPRSRTLFAREHRQHHSQGNYFAPTSKKVAAMVPVIGLTTGLGWLAAGVVGMAYGVGLLCAYVGYELFHRRLHTHAPSNAFGHWARRHHFHHHYGNPRSNHGVTSPFMDMLFHTREEARRPIRVPRKLVMAWLLDPATGEVRQEYAETYVLAGGGPPREDGMPLDEGAVASAGGVS